MSSTESLIRSAELAELTATAKRIVAQIRAAVEIAQHKYGVYNSLDGRGWVDWQFGQEKVTRH